MKKTLDFITRGTCARSIRVVLEDNIIQEVSFSGGCSGNTQGIAALVRGMTAEEAASRMRGIRCGFKNTSCPDQFAKALEACLTSGEGAE